MGITDAAILTALDEQFMDQALLLASEAEANGEVPVGAVLVANGQVIATGRNGPVESNDPTAHAEIMALRSAANKLANYRLPGTTLYVTLEPCAMCAGAMVHARIGRLVYGCTDPRGGAAGTVFNVVDCTALNHRISVTGGVRNDECQAVLQAFFRTRR